jgi:dolichol-phosphate mannosyltransferase
MTVDYSVVLPAYNESVGLIPLVDRIVAALSPLGKSYEIILVNDGSGDDTWEVIRGLAARHPQVKGLCFPRNFGHQLALHAGIKHSSGRCLALMDSDGQDPPELLPRMFELIEEGRDVVNCVRRERKENLLKRSCYYWFYRLYNYFVPFEVTKDSGDFCAMNRRTADILANTTQHNPFLRGLRSWTGGNQIDLPYERDARFSGQPKYRFRHLFLLALNGITSFSKIPLRLSIVVGLLISFSSLCYAILVVYLKLFTSVLEGLTGWATLAFLVSFLGGAILTVLGIIGEYLGTIFEAVRGVPPFLVSETIGFEDTPESSSENVVVIER